MRGEREEKERRKRREREEKERWAIVVRKRYFVGGEKSVENRLDKA